MGKLLQQNLGGAHPQSPQDAAAAAAISQRVAAMRQHRAAAAQQALAAAPEAQQAAEAAVPGAASDGTQPRAVKEKKKWCKKARESRELQLWLLHWGPAGAPLLSWEGFRLPSCRVAWQMPACFSHA